MSIDRYDPIRVLGEGSFGKVYLMRDKIKRNFVCVKIIKIKNIPKKEREATKIEVDLLKRLHHPNIVRYVDSFLSRNNESLCICMEYCDGGDLASQIKAAKRNLFSESKILHWFVQLALGLHYMHSNKVLHRDLKTQNIFLLGNGRLVLGDLGISKVLDGTMDFAQTCIGTPYYMSPEIFQNKPYSYKSDVWALGCVLYEMTTLNHAFDANSLNGLATKIIKGKYPPINAKYSRYLRELIAQMLLLNPTQRPDLDQILRKSFIKKHVINFFVDIASRPSQSIGEGTMIFKAAAGGQANGSIMNDTNMISLRQQLHVLDMTQAVQDAMQPRATPADDEEAIKLARDQAGALKREQEHKKMVEAALEKLRQEREIRAKQRQDPYGRNAARPGAPGIVQRPSDPRRAAGGPAPAAAAQAGAVGAGPSAAARREGAGAPLGGGGGGMAAAAAGVRDRGVNWIRRVDDAGAGGAPRDDPAGRRRSYGEEQERIREREREKEREREREKERERERRAAEEAARRKALQDAENRRVEDRRREEVKAEARAREEARLREEARQKEEYAERLRMEQVRERAEAAAKAKREALRDRQRMEFEQLKRDKIELDRRTQEKEQRLRADRGRRDQQLDVMQEKLDHMNDQISRLEIPRSRADEKSSEEMSARERVVQRRQEKQAKEEADRLEALREAEAENRRLRLQAQENKNKIYADNAHVLPGYAASNNLPKRRAGDVEDVYEFDRNRSSNRRMDADELNDRLEEATRGKGSRFDSSPSVHSDYADVRRQHRPAGSDASHLGRDRSAPPAAHSHLEINTDSGSEEEFWEKGEANVEEEEEDLRQREEELQAELQFATQRVEDLRRTLEATKTYLGPRLPTRGKDVISKPQVVVQEDVVEDEDEDLFDLDEEEYEESWEDPNARNYRKPAGPSYGRESERSDIGADSTLRRMKVPEPAVASYEQPSPSGRLSDRIERLRQLCIEALGRDAFTDAYIFLKQHDEESQGYDNGRDLNDDDFEAKKIARCKAILGEGKAQYMQLIDQLIFMEETHLG